MILEEDMVQTVLGCALEVETGSMVKKNPGSQGNLTRQEVEAEAPEGRR